MGPGPFRSQFLLPPLGLVCLGLVWLGLLTVLVSLAGSIEQLWPVPFLFQNGIGLLFGSSDLWLEAPSLLVANLLFQVSLFAAPDYLL